MKPVEHYAKLISAVSQPAHIQMGRDRQIISLFQYPEPVVFILHEGTVSLYRGHDHLLMANLKAPIAIGFNFLVEKNQDIYFQARGVVAFELVSRSTCLEIITSNNLWESVAYSFMFTTESFTQNHFLSTGVSTYELVCNNLQILMEEDESLRLRTNACDFIQEKTSLSRSGIMKMLGDLKKGGYIELQRGVLLKIHKLPIKY